MDDFQIFISYRRDGGEFLAGRVSDKLSDLGYAVFYDIESMRSGPFNQQIYAAIDQCEAVLLVLPPKGLDRCRDEGDWVRKEIEYALKTDKKIIPLLMRDFTFPSDLPESILGIEFCEGVTVDSQYFDAMILRVCNLMNLKPLKEKEKESENLKNGIRFLNRKMFSQALACFEAEIQTNLSDPEPYFYAAIAKLAGKRPFLLNRAQIGEIEAYLESALAYGECGLYYYLYAYIKRDYYEQKLLKTAPSSKQLLELAEELGMTDKEEETLFELLGTPKPEGF